MIETTPLRSKLFQLAIRGVLTRRSSGTALQFIAEAMKKGDVPERNPVSDPPYQVPEGWEWCRLCEIAYVASGSTPAKSCFVEDGIPYLKMYNLRNQQIDFAYKPQYISVETHNGKLARSRAEPGDLIMNIVGPPLGKLAIIPPTLKQCNFNQAAVMIRPYAEKETVGKYLYYYLWEMGEINSLETKGTAGQDNISLTQCRNLRIALPPLAEQKAIVKRLEELLALEREIAADAAALDDLITAAKRKILDLAVSGKFVPKTGEWKVSKIGAIADVARGGSPRPIKDYLTDDPDGLNWIKIGDASAGSKYIVSVKERIRREGLRKTRQVVPGDLLLTNSMSFGHPYILQVEGCIHDGWLVLHPSGEIDKEYLYYVLMAPATMMVFRSLASGGVVSNLNSDKVASVEISYPPLAEQKAIVKRVEELFAVLDAMKEV